MNIENVDSKPQSFKELSLRQVPPVFGIGFVEEGKPLHHLAEEMFHTLVLRLVGLPSPIVMDRTTGLAACSHLLSFYSHVPDRYLREAIEQLSRVGLEELTGEGAAEIIRKFVGERFDKQVYRAVLAQARKLEQFDVDDEVWKHALSLAKAERDRILKLAEAW